MDTKSEPVWQEFMSESGTSMNGNIEEGILVDLEDDTSNRNPTVWREFASDPGINLSDDNVSVPQRHSLPPTRPRSDDHRKKQTTLDLLAEKYGVASNKQINNDRDPQWVTPNVFGQTPEDSPVTMVASNSGATNTNLPTRPLTIGENETAIVYRPLSPFNPDLYPSRNSIPVTTVAAQTQPIPDLDDDMDMSARERLQPLGRDGLEVKQGPPWGMSMPLFQPYSRESSMSSDDSGSYTRMQVMPHTPKHDNEPGQISRRSSIRSVESKEPVAAVKIPTPDKDSIGPRKSLEADSIHGSNSTVANLLASNNITNVPYPAQMVSTDINKVPYSTPKQVVSTEVPYAKPTQIVSTDLNKVPYFAPREMVSTEVPYFKPAQMVSTEVPYLKPAQIVSTDSNEIPYSTPRQMVSTDTNMSPYLKQAPMMFAEVPYLKPTQMVSTDRNKVPYSTSTQMVSTEVPYLQPAQIVSTDTNKVPYSTPAHMVSTEVPYSSPQIVSTDDNLTTTWVTPQTMESSLKDSGAEMWTPTTLSSGRHSAPILDGNVGDGVVTTNSNDITTLNSSNSEHQSLKARMSPGELGLFRDDKMNISIPKSNSITSLQSLAMDKPGNFDKFRYKTPVGRFHDTNMKKTDTDSPVSRILGPTFKTTQRILQELQKRPLASYQTNVVPRVAEKELASVSTGFLEQNKVEVSPIVPASPNISQRSDAVANDSSSDNKGNNISKSDEGLISLDVETRVRNPDNVDSVGGSGVGFVGSMSWDNMLGARANEYSEFERVASQSISISNAVANSFREELNKTDTLLDIDSGEEEGVLTDVSTRMDSGVSETSTNEEYFQPKGLTPLSKKQPAIGIYDVRKSSSPGSTNRKRVALGRSVIKASTGLGRLYTPVYVSEERSSTEVEEKAGVNIPDGRSTPKTEETTQDKQHRIKTLANTYSVNGVRRTTSPSNVDSTWSVKSPVMSQLDSRAKPLFLPQHNANDKARRVYNPRHERKRQTRVQTGVNDSSDSSRHDTPAKTNVADVILENFRRDEKEQKRRQLKMEALKQMDSTADLNALWSRFQEVFGKKRAHGRHKHHFTPKLIRTPPQSEFSSAIDADISGNSSNNTLVGSSDSNKEFDRYLQRVREIESTFSESTDYRRQSVPSTDGTRSKSSRRSVHSSELETPLIKAVSERPTGLKEPFVNMHSVCTCGARKVKGKPPQVREVGINCPTPPIPVNNIPTVKDTGYEATKITPVEDMVHLIHAPPDSLVKLSLQDAFMYSNQDFIKRSRQRVAEIKVKKHEMAKNIIVIPTEKTKPRTDDQEELQTEVDKPLRVYAQLGLKKPRPMSRKEIRNVNKRMCKKLPEVKKRKEEERRAAYYQTNRLRAQLYGKHVRNLNRMYTVH